MRISKTRVDVSLVVCSEYFSTNVSYLFSPPGPRDLDIKSFFLPPFLTTQKFSGKTDQTHQSESPQPVKTSKLKNHELSWQNGKITESQLTAAHNKLCPIKPESVIKLETVLEDIIATESHMSITAQNPVCWLCV